MEDIKEIEKFYKNEGVAIFVKGEMIYGIYPDNVENNLKALANGHMNFIWNNYLNGRNESEKEEREYQNYLRLKEKYEKEN